MISTENGKLKTQNRGIKALELNCSLNSFIKELKDSNHSLEEQLKYRLEQGERLEG